MKVALYYPWIYLTSGAERSILELTGRSRHDWTLFTSHYDPAHTFPGFSERNVVQVGNVSVDRRLGPVAKSGYQILKLRLPIERFDALVVVCEGLGDLIVFRNAKVPVICLCLTPLRLVFDAAYRARTTQGRGPGAKLTIAMGSAVFRWVDRLAWKKYTRVFCISEEVKRRAMSGKLAPEHKLEVLRVGLGFEPSKPSGCFEHFFLLPGRIMWTKNIELGIEAFKIFRAERPEHRDFRLVVAGIVDRKSEPYLERIRALAAEDPHIEFRIFPSDAELADLYSRCYGVLFTAFNEDWGIVPLESMAFGKPVISTDQGGPRETVLHEVNGFLESPNPQAFARRLTELAGDQARAESMGKAGHIHSRRFTWTEFTDRIDRMIEEIGPTERRPSTGPQFVSGTN